MLFYLPPNDCHHIISKLARLCILAQAIPVPFPVPSTLRHPPKQVLRLMILPGNKLRLRHNAFAENSPSHPAVLNHPRTYLTNDTAQDRCRSNSAAFSSIPPWEKTSIKQAPRKRRSVPKHPHRCRPAAPQYSPPPPPFHVRAYPRRSAGHAAQPVRRRGRRRSRGPKSRCQYYGASNLSVVGLATSMYV